MNNYVLSNFDFCRRSLESLHERSKNSGLEIFVAPIYARDESLRQQFDRFRFRWFTFDDLSSPSSPENGPKTSCALNMFCNEAKISKTVKYLNSNLVGSGIVEGKVALHERMKTTDNFAVHHNHPYNSFYQKHFANSLQDFRNRSSQFRSFRHYLSEVAGLELVRSTFDVDTADEGWETLVGKC